MSSCGVFIEIFPRDSSLGTGLDGEAGTILHGIHLTRRLTPGREVGGTREAGGGERRGGSGLL